MTTARFAELLIASPVGRNLCASLLLDGLWHKVTLEHEEISRRAVRSAIDVSALSMDVATTGASVLSNLPEETEARLVDVARVLARLVYVDWRRPWSDFLQLRLLGEDEPLTRPVAMSEEIIPDPPARAVWSCSANEEQIQDWRVLETEAGAPPVTEPNWFMFRATGRETVFEICDPSDWIELVQMYPSSPSYAGFVYPDWEKMATDFDGLHLTTAGLVTVQGRLLQTAVGHTLLWGWNTESCLWLRPWWLGE